MRDSEGRIAHDSGPSCDVLLGELACGRPRGHGGKHEFEREADGRSAYRAGGPLDVRKEGAIGALGEH